MQEYFAALAENFVKSIPNLLIAILILVISIYGGILLARILRRVLVRNNAEPGITHLLTKTLQWTFIILGTITAIQRFFNVTAFFDRLGHYRLHRWFCDAKHRTEFCFRCDLAGAATLPCER